VKGKDYNCLFDQLIHTKYNMRRVPIPPIILCYSVSEIVRVK